MNLEKSCYVYINVCVPVYSEHLIQQVSVLSNTQIQSTRTSLERPGLMSIFSSPWACFCLFIWHSQKWKNVAVLFWSGASSHMLWFVFNFCGSFLSFFVSFFLFLFFNENNILPLQRHLLVRCCTLWSGIKPHPLKHETFAAAKVPILHK